MLVRCTDWNQFSTAPISTFGICIPVGPDYTLRVAVTQCDTTKGKPLWVCGLLMDISRANELER